MEAFGKGQKGSSAMPHKKNPILSENLCGLARMLRHYAGAALENVALWHERDISHSSVERMIGPDATATADFMVRRAASLVDGPGGEHRPHAREPGADRRPVLQRGGAAGPDRQGHGPPGGLRAGAETRPGGLGQHRPAAVNVDPGTSFRELLAADPEVAGKLSAEELGRCFDLEHHLRFTGEIVDRALRAP